LRLRGGFHRWMVVAEHDRSVRAHVVDVLVAIDVPHVRARAALEEVRVRAFDEHARRLMAVDPGGNEAPGTLVELFAATKPAMIARHCFALRRGSIGEDPCTR